MGLMLKPVSTQQEYQIGPLTQLLPLSELPEKGPIDDSKLTIYTDCFLHIKERKIHAILPKPSPDLKCIECPFPTVALPGFIDAHTHICFAGSRARDFSDRLNRVSYQEILSRGGGIYETVSHTQRASEDHLVSLILERCKLLTSWGVTTCEVKSGYGLTVEEELKLLRSIVKANLTSDVNLIPTCLAAHVPPKETSPKEYLDTLIKELLPILLKEKLCKRVDIFVEENAFSVELAREYLLKAKSMGFKVTLHADQFTRGGGQLACEVGACSAEHLEASTTEDFLLMAKSNVTPVVLPGASIGLGLPFASANKILDANLPLVIASDWNPGSAPMGDLLTQASILSTMEKLSTAETFAALTTRPAKLLKLHSKGQLRPGFDADVILFPTDDYREILYAQGRMKPWKTICK